MRIPGSTKTLATGVDGLEFSTIKEMIAEHGADGYYILHNHPSWNTAPSTPDIDTTKVNAKETPGFLGYVVIDHKEYVVVAPDRNSQKFMLDDCVNI